MSLKNSNDIIGIRTRDLPVCSVVPQPLRYRAPLIIDLSKAKYTAYVPLMVKGNMNNDIS